jgi:WD40 repeat protein
MSPKQTENEKLHLLLYDAMRLVQLSRVGVQQAPLQLYASALVFAPKESIIRKSFERYIPGWITKLPQTANRWGEDVQTFEGHNEKVCCVAFAANGSELIMVSGSQDGSVKVWDAHLGTERATLQGFDRSIEAVAASNTKRQIIVASVDVMGTTKVWDVESAKQLWSIDHSANYDTFTLTFSPKGDVLALGCEGGKTKLWDSDSGRHLHTLKGDNKEFSKIAFSSNGAVVAAISPSTFQLWNVQSGHRLPHAERPNGCGNNLSIVFLPNTFNELYGNDVVIASTAREGGLLIWNVQSGQELHTVANDSSLFIQKATFSPHGTFIAFTVHGSDLIVLWDIHSKRVLDSIEWDPNCMEFSPNGGFLAFAGRLDNIVRLWDFRSHEMMERAYKDEIIAVSIGFSADGSVMAVKSWSEIEIWNVQTRQKLHTVENNGIGFLEFSPDARMLVGMSSVGSIHVWDIQSGKIIRSLESESHWRNTSVLTFAQSGTMLAFPSDNHAMTIWNVQTGKELHSLVGHEKRVLGISFSPDSTKVISMSQDCIIKLWDTDTGKLLKTFDISNSGTGRREFAIGFVPNCAMIAIAGWDGTVTLLDAETGTILQTLNLGEQIHVFSFSEDGSTLHTNKGTFDVSIDLSRPDPLTMTPALLVKDQWLVRGEKNILWIPPEFRSETAAVSGKLMILGRQGNGLLWLDFNFD